MSLGASLLVVAMHGVGAEPPAPAEPSFSVTVALAAGHPAAPCTDARVLRTRLAEMLERPIEAPTSDPSDPGATLTLEVASRSTNGVQVSVEYGALALRRDLQIESSACDAACDAIVLVAALLVDEALQRGRPVTIVDTEPAPEPEAEPEREPEPPPRPQPEPEPEPEPTPRLPGWATNVALAGQLAYGDLPRLSGGVGLRVELSPRSRWAFGVASTVWPFDRIEQGPYVGRFSAFEGVAFACVVAWQGTRVSLRPCVDGRAGAIQAVGQGFAESRGAVRPRVLVDAELRARVVLVGPWTLDLGAGLGVPIVRDAFVFRDESGGAQTLHRTGAVVPFLFAAIGLQADLLRRSAPARSSRGPRLDNSASLATSTP